MFCVANWVVYCLCLSMFFCDCELCCFVWRVCLFLSAFVYVCYLVGLGCCVLPLCLCVMVCFVFVWVSLLFVLCIPSVKHGLSRDCVLCC